MKTLTTITIMALFLPGVVFGQSSEVHQDDEIVVTESRYDDDTKLNLTNITFEDLQFREPDLELPLLLQDVPGVFSYSDAGSGFGYSYIKIRGFDQRRVGVLFNGIPFNDPEDHQIWWVDLPDLASSVQDIQVQRGITNSVGGMTAIGGTVNIISRDLTAHEQGQVSVNYGSYGTQRQMIQYQTGDIKNSGFRSMIRLSRQESDGYRDRSGNNGWAVFWSLQYESAKMLTKVNIYTGREVTEHAWDAVPESVLQTNRKANAETYANAIDDFRQPHYELHNTWFLADNVELTNRFYYIKGEGYYENFKADQQAEDYALDTLLGVPADTEIDLVRQKWVRKEQTGWVPHLNWQQGASRLTVGGDWYTFHSNHWGDVLWAEGLTPDDIVGGYNYHQYTGDKNQYSLFVKERWDVGGGLILTADLHYQHKEYSFKQDEAGNFTGSLLNAYTVNYDFFNPKGAVNWRANEAWKFYGSVGVNSREPTDNELFNTFQGGDDLGVEPLFANRREVLNSDGTVNYVEWSDPFVKAERVVDYELGFSWQSAVVAIDIGGYWMDFENEIVALGGVNDDGSGIRGNAGETRHQGVELEMAAQVTEQHKISLAASRSWDKFVEYIYFDYDGVPKDFSGNRIALFPEHLIMASWTSQWHSDFRTRLRVRNTGRQQIDNTGNADHSIDPWTTVDVSFWYELGGKGTTAFVHLRNLADTEYETWGYYFGENYYTPGAGRNYVVGLDYDF